MPNSTDKIPAQEPIDVELQTVSDADPGIQRRRAGKGFVYTAPDGSLVRDKDTLRRIRALVIPPAWSEVWICTFPNGHIQATGRDAKGRKQYRYHALWHQRSNAEKFSRTLQFGEALPTIRERVEADLALPGLPRAKVLALIVRLLEETLIRIGNSEYARNNKSFGLTTLQDKHVTVTDSKVKFCFRGKSGVEHEISVNDKRLAKLVRRVRDVPGKELFQYVDENGTRHKVSSGDVNAYLREISGADFTAKDFRTWGGSILAARTLLGLDAYTTKKEARKNISAMIRDVAAHLGNTTTVCKKYYIHPVIIDAYNDGTFAKLFPKVEADDFEKLLMKVLRKTMRLKEKTG
jgi:DNA topoisomerase I